MTTTTALIVSLLVVGVAWFDVHSTEKALATGDKELNPVFAFLQREFRSSWAYVYLAVNVLLAAVIFSIFTPFIFIFVVFALGWRVVVIRQNYRNAKRK